MKLISGGTTSPLGLLAAALALLLAATACSSSNGGGNGSAPDAGTNLKVYSTESELVDAAKAEGGQLDIYLSSELENLNTEFKKAYPFVNVTQTGLQPSAAAAKWSTELSADVHNVDALMTYVTNVPEFSAKGEVAKVQVPNDALVGESQKDPSNYFHDVINVPSALLYNTKLLPDGGPENLQDLTDPKWKSQIVMDNPAVGGPTGLAMAAMKPVIGDQWEQYLKDIEANEPQLTDSSSSSYDALVRGERALCVCSYHDFVAQDAGAPVKATLYNQSSTGLVQQGNAIAIASKAKHPATAALWVNWLLSPTGGQKLVAESGRTPTVADVPGAEKVTVPPGTKLASFTALGAYLDDPAPYNDIYKKVFRG